MFKHANMAGIARYGGVLDVFGHSDERRQERAWLAQYHSVMCEICMKIACSPCVESAECYKNALSLALIPQDIRGYGHVKTRHMAQAMEKWQSGSTQFRDSAAP